MSHLATAAFVLVPVFTASVALARKAPDVKPLTGTATARVIAVYKTDVNDSHTGKVTGKNGKIHRMMRNTRAVSFDVNREALEELDKDSDVEYIAPDRPLSGANLGEAETAVKLWQVGSWYASNGNCRGCTRGPIGVAVLDSGIQPNHADLARWNSTNSRVVYKESFVDANPADLNGHGTHVAGIIGAEGNISCLQGGLDASGNCRASQTFIGIAPGTQFVSLKVLDANGQGTDSGVIAAIDRAIALKSTYNIRVMNISLGRPVRESYQTDPLCRAVARAWDAGIVVVVAAGNEGRNNSAGTNGYGTISSPANSPKAITVGAINTLANFYDADDRAATYSAKGPTMIDQIVKPDLVAPGNAIVSLQASGSVLPAQYPGNRPAVASYWPWATGTSSYYYKLSGTSMAAPMVSGAAALLIDKDPTLTPDMVKARLMKTARRGLVKTVSVYDTATAKWYSITHDIFTVGAGVLDINAAFNATFKPVGSAASPKAVYNSATRKVSLNFAATGGSNVIWGDSAGYYSTNVIWGENVIWGTNVIWGDNVIWSDGVTTGFRAVWGASSPFTSGSNSMEAASIAINGDQ
jgi:serine protease AprX